MLLQLFTKLYIIGVYVWQNVNCAHHSDALTHKSLRHQNWQRLEMMDNNGLYWLEWQVKEKDIHFKVTVNTRGFVGLGFSKRDARMSTADMVLLWVDDQTGKANALVSIIAKSALKVYKYLKF